MDEVEQAVLPAAGRGTRLARVRGDGPKELLAVGGIPLIDRAVREAFLGGVKRVILVLSPEKAAMGERFRDLAALAALGAGDGERSVETAVQEHPTGLADAIRIARDRMEPGPFALLLPDNVYDGDPLGEMLPAFRARRISVAGLLDVPPEDWNGFGNCGAVETKAEEGWLRIVRLGPKGSGPFRGENPNAPARRWFGRSILTPAFFDEWGRAAFPPGAERDDVPVLQRMVAGEGVLGVPLRGRGFDAGNETGLARARAYYEYERGSDR
ncbi:MAG: NTP transferase domain-containing protein [Candidatus Eisenbacteria bacterium]|nr:NTP transferase domain-containing protein [Candidatus Eisenbacteria bacterium]